MCPISCRDYGNWGKEAEERLAPPLATSYRVSKSKTSAVILGRLVSSTSP